MSGDVTGSPPEPTAHVSPALRAAPTPMDATWIGEDAMSFSLARSDSKELLHTEKDAPNFFRKVTVTSSHQHGDVLLREFAMPTFAAGGPVVLEAFPQDTLVVAIAAQFLSDQLELPLIGDIVCPTLPAAAVIKDAMPSGACRIYGNEHIVVFRGEYRYSNILAHMVAEAIYGFCERHSARLLVTVEGMEETGITLPQGESIPKDPKEAEVFIAARVADREAQGPKMKFLTSIEEFGTKLAASKHAPIGTAVVAGFSGHIVSEAATRPTHVLFILISFMGAKAVQEVQAAVLLIRTLVELVPENLPIKVDSLDERAAAVLGKLQEALEAARSPAPETRTCLSPRSLMYS